MVKFGFFEVQLGFKSCTGYLCKRKRKRKRNVNKIHQISLENNLIVHKIKEMQDSWSVQKTTFDKIHIGDWKCKVEQDNNLWIKQCHIHLATSCKFKFWLYSHICNFLKLVNFFQKVKWVMKEDHLHAKWVSKYNSTIDYHHIMVWWNISQ